MGVSDSASGCPLSARPGAHSFDRDAATGHQQHPGADEPRDKAQVECGADIPLDGIAGAPGRAVMCEQDEMWQESRYFSEAKMGELYDENRTRGIDGTVDWARLEAEAGKMIETGLELADRIEAA